MIFKNYCGVFFNPIDDLNAIISKISEDSPRVMKGKGISIYTFTSVIDATILTDYFKSYNLNFFVFDLSKNNSGVNFTDKDKETDLFGFLDKNIKSDFENLSNILMDDIIKNSSVNKKLEPNINPVLKYKNETKKDDDLDRLLDSIENMSKNDRNNILNDIIDKGVENLDESDKKILEKISKLQ